MLENYVAGSVQEQAAPVPQLMPRDGMRRMDRQMAMIRSDLLLGRLLRHHPERVASAGPPPHIEIEPEKTVVEIIPTPLAIEAVETLGRDYPSIRSIQSIVSQYFEITVPEMVSHRRNHELLFVRFIAIYLAKKLTPLSYAHIGRRFGDRDHSTVINAISKVEKKMEKCERTKDDVDLLTLHIKSAMLKGAA